MDAKDVPVLPMQEKLKVALPLHRSRLPVKKMAVEARRFCGVPSAGHRRHQLSVS